MRLFFNLSYLEIQIIHFKRHTVQKNRDEDLSNNDQSKLDCYYYYIKILRLCFELNL